MSGPATPWQLRQTAHPSSSAYHGTASPLHFASRPTHQGLRRWCKGNGGLGEPIQYCNQPTRYVHLCNVDFFGGSHNNFQKLVKPCWTVGRPGHRVRSKQFNSIATTMTPKTKIFSTPIAFDWHVAMVLPKVQMLSKHIEHNFGVLGLGAAASF